MYHMRLLLNWLALQHKLYQLICHCVDNLVGMCRRFAVRHLELAVGTVGRWNRQRQNDVFTLES